MQGELPRIGAELAGYRLESLVSRGGMAVVYLAEDLRLARKVALKILALELAEDDNFRERFLRESRIAASIDHPNVIPIYDAGEADGLLYIAMRHVEDTDLRGLLRAEAPLDFDRSIALAIQVASALGAAHRHELVHRDVKPANVLLIPRDGPDSFDHAYLSDFGLAKHSSSVSGLTATGQFLGTVSYAAPEQVEGKPVDGRTDIYALGCVLFECLTGQPPFVREEGLAVVLAHLNDPAPLVTDLRPSCPPALARVVDIMLAKKPDDRYADCEELVAALRLVARAYGGPTLSETRTASEDSEPAGAAPPALPPDGAPEPESEPAPEAEATPAPEPERRPRVAVPGGIRALIALALAGVAALVVVLLAGGGGDEDAPGGAEEEGGDPGLVSTIEGGAQWRSFDDAPTPRQQAGGASVEGKVWIVGGLEGEEATTATTKVDVFDPATETWADGPDLPEPLHHVVARNYRGELVVIGGWAPEGSDLTAETSDRVYALRDDEWVALPELNHPRAAAAAAVLGGRLVVVGGQAGGELVPETEVFDGKRWRDVAPLPTPREHLAAASDGRYVYVLGGRELSSDENLGTLERYDPVNDRWSELPPMPNAVGSFDAAVTLGHLVAVGGEEPTGAIGDVQSFDLESETWSSLPSLGVPRHGLTVVADGNLLYALVGAQEVAHAESTAAAEVLDLSVAFATPPAVSGWRAINTDAPTARQQAAGAILAGRLWLIGGLTGAEGVPTATTEFYDQAVGGWSSGPELPIELHHATAATYEDEIVVIGGWIPEGSDLTAETSSRVFALRDREWVELPELNNPRAATGAAVVGDRLIVTGGQADGELVPSTEVFDGERWTEVAPIPTPREHLAVASDGTYLYAVGGRNLSANENLTALERYDPEADEWARLPEMPIASGGFGAAVVDGYLVTVGGESALEVFDAVQAFDLETNIWSALPPTRTPRHGHVVLALDESLYALGGALEPGHTESSPTAEALDFE